MLVDAVTVRFVRWKQCILSMNDLKAWHDTYLAGNAHSKCCNMFLDEISRLLAKYNWLNQNNFFFAKYRFLFCRLLAYFHFANYRFPEVLMSWFVFVAFHFVSQITESHFLLLCIWSSNNFHHTCFHFWWY